MSLRGNGSISEKRREKLQNFLGEQLDQVDSKEKLLPYLKLLLSVKELLEKEFLDKSMEKVQGWN